MVFFVKKATHLAGVLKPPRAMPQLFQAEKLILTPNKHELKDPRATPISIYEIHLGSWRYNSNSIALSHI